MWVKPEAGFSEMLKIYSGSQAGKDIASVMTHWTKTKSRCTTAKQSRMFTGVVHRS